MIDMEHFWRSTGAKFVGTEEDWEDVFTGCDKQHAWTDDEGYFNAFLCMIDWKKCDKQCLKHHVKINPDVEEFVENLNKNLENKGEEK